MKFRSIILATITLLTSTISFAAVMTSSSNIDFLAIDGKKASGSLLKETRSFNINNNQLHQVVVRVAEIVREGSDRSLFESDPIIVTFQGTNEDLIISAPRLNNKRDVDNFTKNPDITIKTRSGSVISIKQEYLKQEGFLPNANLIENLSEYNASGSTASVPAFAMATLSGGIPNAASGKVQKGKVTVQGENAAEQMLQYWFQQADKETQQRFLKWAQAQ